MKMVKISKKKFFDDNYIKVDGPTPFKLFR